MTARRCISAILAAAMVAAVAGPAGAMIFENTSHEMAAGDFFGDGKNSN